MCGGPATIRDTEAEDGRLHFVCHEVAPDGKAKHYGFVDRSEAEKVEEGQPSTADGADTDNGANVGASDEGFRIDWG